MQARLQCHGPGRRTAADPLRPGVTRASLLLAAHGSPHNGDSSAPVYAHAQRIRELRLFDEVRAAFWKEEPLLRNAFEGVRSEDVFVVPMFLADGYYAREVVPRELGLQGALTRRGSQRIHYGRPVGAHPRMEELVLRRVTETAPLSRAERRRATLVVIGHGTPRSSTSSRTVHDVTARLRERSGFGAVDCGFLDEAPRIVDVVEQAESRELVLVPYFLAEGWHTRQTIPHTLRLTGRCTRRDGQKIWYAPPVGTLPEMAGVIIDLVREMGLREQ